jgi:hypothetical protein
MKYKYIVLNLYDYAIIGSRELSRVFEDARFIGELPFAYRYNNDELLLLYCYNVKDFI